MTELRDIIIDVANRIRCHWYFWSTPVIPVITPAESTFHTDVETVFASPKLFVVVDLDEASSKAGNMPGPFLDNVMFTALVVENRQFNDGGKTADLAASYVAATLQQWRNTTLNSALRLTRLATLQPPSPEDAHIRQYVVSLTSGLLLDDSATTTTAAPSVVQGATKVTITGTAGASFRYTTNGSDPEIGDTAYTVPFTNPTAGTVVKARAFKASQIASAVTSLTITS